MTGRARPTKKAKSIARKKAQTSIVVDFHPRELAAIDRWSDRRSSKISRPEAIRCLTSVGLEVSSSLDSLSEMGEMESLRLQMAMDRMSKMMSMLSNLLKKIGETEESIINNMK